MLANIGVGNMLMVYQLHLTPREAERLRNVSYQRQLEAGMKNPGSAGLVGLGDCEPWIYDTGLSKETL
jgi:hypothetical protein